jgi:hypothetical protein
MEVKLSAPMLTSIVCRAEHFATSWYLRWEALFNKTGPHAGAPRLNRKPWEWAAIAQAAFERGLLREGVRGLGFGVGKEPLAAIFASHGVQVDAIDLPPDDASASHWMQTGQHAASLATLYFPALIDRSTFERNVHFSFGDMRSLGHLPKRSYDFVWSSCAFEHLGNLSLGAHFLLESSHLIKDGGFGIHTTEFNVSSNIETIDTGPVVFYRRRDLEQIEGLLRHGGYGLEPLDLFPGNAREDIAYDYPPYFSHTDRHHVKLIMLDHVITSLLLIVDC